nr:hypothetical protein HmN_000449200 [Hymenolepis microstoma]
MSPQLPPKLLTTPHNSSQRLPRCDTSGVDGGDGGDGGGGVIGSVVLGCQRPYHVESTGSRPITEVKLWVTGWEYPVLLTPFHLFSSLPQSLNPSTPLSLLSPFIHIYIHHYQPTTLPQYRGTCISNLDELTEVAESVQALYVYPHVHAMETPIPSPFSHNNLTFVQNLCGRWILSCQNSPIPMTSASQNTGTKSATITGHTETTPGNVIQASNPSKLTVQSRISIPLVLKSTLSLV